MDRGTLLLIGPDGSDRGFFRRTFHPFEVRLAHFETAEEAIAALPLPRPLIAILSLPLDCNGLQQAIARLRSVDPTLVGLVAARASCSLSVAELAHCGAYGSLSRPLESAAWRQLVGDALAMSYDTINRVSYEPLLDGEDWDEAIIARCEVMHSVIVHLSSLANRTGPILITGERGTGKTLVARALHQHSKWREGPFVTARRSRLSDDAPLDGNSVGKAARAKPQLTHEWGPAHYADRGALFVPDLAALPLRAQEELLRLVSNPSRQGTPCNPDALVIVATTESSEGHITHRGPARELYDRLRPNSIHLPPLRERPGDLRALIDYFLNQHADAFWTPRKKFAPEVIAALERYPWPGNVRELQQLVKRVLLTARGDVALLGDLPLHMLDCVAMPEHRPPQLEFHTFSDRWLGQSQDGLTQVSRTLFDWSRKDRRFRIIPAMERQLILHALTETRGNQVQAAKLLGISRATLRTRLERLDVKRELVVR